MTYQEVTDFLFNQFPQFQKVGSTAYKPGLDTIKALCKLLGNPQENLKIIHVAGTNGKGSVCNMTASILMQAGYSVGVFSSPHLIDYRERFRINGKMISKEEVVAFVSQYKNDFEAIDASFFEWSTALAFYYFNAQKVDYVILETGLGGRLDSTNIVNPILSVITKIGIDHTAYLGNTLEEITKEKAGIIKAGVPIVLGQNNKRVKDIVYNIAQELDSDYYNSDSFKNHSYTSDLKGVFQKDNIATVLRVVNVLKERLGVAILNKDVEIGLAQAQVSTNFRGRWETLQIEPKVICDIGHNYDGLSRVVEQLEKEKFEKLHIVFGMVEDKEIDSIVNLLPKNAKYYLCSPKIKRALPTDQLSDSFKEFHEVEAYNSCIQAYNNAVSSASNEDLIFIGGSTFVVSEIILKFFK